MHPVLFSLVNHQSKFQVLFSREDHKGKNCQGPSKKVNLAQRHHQVQSSIRCSKERFHLDQFSKGERLYRSRCLDLCSTEDKLHHRQRHCLVHLKKEEHRL